MEKPNQLLYLCLIAAALTGCATGETPHGGTSPFEVRQHETDTLITVPGTQNKFQISSIRGHLLAGATDKDGNILIGASVEESGKPALTVFDAQRKASLKLGLDDNLEPSLMLRGKNEAGWIVGGFDKHGRPQLNLNVGDTSTGPRVRISFNTKDGVTSPYMLMEGENRKASVVTRFTDGRSPATEMTDSQGRVRVRIGIGEDDAPFFELLDENGKPAAAK